MKKNTNYWFNKILVLTGIFMIWPILANALDETSKAVDSVIELNQVVATATGFPIIISQSGSFRLTSNLRVTGGDGIVIEADNVSLDLNGYTIQGLEGAGRGIYSERSNIAVFNGNVTQMIDNGIVLGDKGRVENVSVISAGGSSAIEAGENSIVRKTIVTNNAGDGIFCLNSCLITDNTVNLNGGGIRAFFGCIAKDNIVNENRNFGFQISEGNTLTNNTIFNNEFDGIEIVGPGNTIFTNSVSFNGNQGITESTQAPVPPGTFGGNTIVNNTIRGNTGLGLNMGETTGYGTNVITENNGGNNSPQVLGGIEIGTNVCGTSTACVPLQPAN